jgi:hypothetical protein
MTRRLANVVIFLLFVLLAVIALDGLLFGQERTPLATDMQKALAPLSVSEDGKTVIFRATAIDALTIRVEPAVGTFGKTISFTVGDVRRGRVGLK